MHDLGLVSPTDRSKLIDRSKIRENAGKIVRRKVREVRVAVNDWVNDLLVLRAEVSRLDEHLVKVPSSVFA